MKNKILIISFLTIIYGIFIYNIILEDKPTSSIERRRLQQFPEFSTEKISSGIYMEELNSYFVDQMPFRENFRKFKGLIDKNIFLKKYENDCYIEDGSIYLLDNKVNAKSINHILNLLSFIDRNILESNQNIYYSIIPDKNYYLKNSNIPKLNYNQIIDNFNDRLNYKYIDLFDTLEANSYYKTDMHWRQEKLDRVVEKISISMNLPQIEMPKNIKKDSEFYGNLYSRITNDLKKDTLYYLSSDELEKVKVYNWEKKKYEKVYEEKNLNNVDKYDIFLSGATPLLIMENKNSDRKAELVIFRDSFASSLAPLLIKNYSKITLIDLRYISSSTLEKLDNFSLKDADIYFLYSIPIINNSFTLK